MRPKSIVRFEIFYLLSFALGIVVSVLNWDTGLAEAQQASPDMANIYPAIILGIIAISAIITLLLWFFAARKASNIARWIITVFFGISILNVIYTLSTGSFPAGLAGLISAVSYVLSALSVAMLFQPESNLWFKDEQSAQETAATFE